MATVIEIQTNRSGFAKNGEIIFARGACPCVVVGILDGVKKIAHVIHEANPEDGSFRDFLDNVLKEVNVSDCLVWTAGCSFTSTGLSDPDVVENSRYVVSEELRKHFDDHRISFAWGPLDTQSTLVIDPSKGCHIEHEIIK